MELVIPFMLFILGISEEDPSDIKLMRHPVLFETEAQCLKAGDEVVRARWIGEHENATYFRVFCKRVPSRDEYDRLFAEMDSKRSAPAKAESE